MKIKLEKQLEELKIKGSIEEIDKTLLSMNKILADIQLLKLKNRAL
jgi:hypothetical protein